MDMEGQRAHFLRNARMLCAEHGNMLSAVELLIEMDEIGIDSDMSRIWLADCLAEGDLVLDELLQVKAPHEEWV